MPGGHLGGAGHAMGQLVPEVLLQGIQDPQGTSEPGAGTLTSAQAT